MIKEDYVSFEVAKLLKDKGFDEHCFCINYPLLGGIHYSIILPNLLNNSMIPFIDKYNFCRCKEDFITIPTLQMAMKWLREVHNLCLFVIPATIDKTFRTGYALYPQCDSKWEWRASKNDRSKAAFGVDINKKYCDSYEQACEAAIKYCLENLI